jgi:hypothetical protein
MRVQSVRQDQREFTEFYAAAWDDCLRIVALSVGTAELQRALAQAGVPAIVTTRSCLQGTQNWPPGSGDGGVTTSANPPGLTITPSKIPSGTKLIFSVTPLIVDGTAETAFGWGLVKNGEPLHCLPAHDPKAPAG